MLHGTLTAPLLRAFLEFYVMFIANFAVALLILLNLPRKLSWTQPLVLSFSLEHVTSWRSSWFSAVYSSFTTVGVFVIPGFPSRSRHSSDKVSKLEGQVESYKKKLEDLGDLRRQVKLLEEKNTMYMQNTVSLEEELRKANAARSQLETYKRQVRGVAWFLRIVSS